MKLITNTLRIVFFMVMACTCVQQANAQVKANAGSALLSSIDAKTYNFIAQSASPLRGGLRQLTSTYDLRISKDTVVSNLPYFGRAFTAPINPSDGGLMFNSTSSQYSVKAGKKGRRDISFNTKQNSDTQHMTLTVFDNGFATLQVNSNNRDTITFNGYVSEIKK